MPTRNLNDRFCASAKARGSEVQTDYFDEQTPGLALRVSKAGSKSWTYHFTWIGKRCRMTFGTYPATSLRSARTKADEAKAAVEARTDPRIQSNGATLKSICEDWLARECGMVREGDKVTFTGTLRRPEERLSVFERLVYPALGDRPIDEIKRSEITAMLDDIADENGPVMADRTLAYVRKVFNWHAARSDDFRPPFVPGMARNAAKERDRTLTDKEIKAIWQAKTEGSLAIFHRYIKVLLLTALRRNEASEGHGREIRDGLWTIPADRMKGKIEFVVPLSPVASDLLGVLTKGHVFSTDGGVTPISGFSKFKAAFDQASGVADWTLHDLRRTARSLMSRAGVSPDIAERLLAHKIGGVRGIYDRYEYLSEKRDALERLAGLIGGIVNA
jgi:integrase